MAEDKKKVVEEEKAVFLPTTAQLDMERREEDARLTPSERRERDRTEGRDFTGDGNDTSAFVGVSPEYMNYSTPGDKPYWAGEDSAVGRVEQELTRGGAVAVVPDPESNQTEGGGSTVPLVYANLSGEDFTNREVTPEEAKAEGERLQPKDETAAAPVVATRTKTPVASDSKTGK